MFSTPPQTVHNPGAVAKFFAFMSGRALVSVSAVISSVEQWINLMVSALIIYQIK
jgi:hypothetical protein